MPSFKIVTFGCKVNQYESAFIRESLIREGWSEAAEEQRPDVVIVNTCMVTHEAQSQSRQAINRAARENPNSRIAVSGCYAELLPDEVARLNGVDLIAGNRLKGRIPAILSGNEAGDDAPGCGFSGGVPLEHLPVEDFGGRTRGYLKIQDGCESYCSYCIVPHARGPLRSIEPSEAVRALHSLSEKGYKEVVLTGIHLGKYGVDRSPATSLKELLNHISGEKMPLRIRLSSIEPNEVDPGLIRLIAEEDWICKHLHIPLQSGDDRILKRMNRRYSSKDYVRVVQSIKESIPLAAIGLDVMVGFPGENEGAFENTRSLISDLPVSYLHVFPFSPRSGTPAATFPDRVPAALIKRRAAELRALGQSKRALFYSSCRGKTLTVLVQGWDPQRKMADGLSDNYVPVQFHCPGGLKNTFVRVLVEGTGGKGVSARVIEDTQV